MIGYVCLGTNDLMEFGTFIAWSAGKNSPGLALTRPFNGKPATVGNGVMVALAVDSPAKVDAMYRKAMELGATDEGPAGPRGDDFYAGYFRDPDGNKLSFFYSK
jgi:catechol 2,3-dioxygenase-like lactoylglutathione lyase family enzyme